MPIQSSVSVGGVQGVRAVRFPFGRGVSPSIACVTCVPQTANPTGTITFSYNGRSFSFSDMALVSSHVHLRRDKRHPLMRMYLKDRRWRWEGIRISGDWNRRYASGVVDETVRKSPAELATLLLQRLGESNFDVSQMPTGMYPRALWDGTRCDLALQKLCEDVCCEVVLSPETNRIEIWPSGVGQETPTGVGEATPKYVSFPRAYVPSSVVLAGGESLYQYRLRLKAIGRQGNLQERDLEDVDWAAGLTNTESFNFPNLTGLNQALALATAWRQYRILGLEGGGLQVPGVPFPVTSTSQYVLRDYILFSVRDVNGFLQKLPYYIEGDFWPYSDLANNVSGQVFLGPSKLYAERGIVEFEYPVVKLTSAGALDATGPVLYIQTAYSVKDFNGLPHRVSGSVSIGGSGGVLNIYRPEIFAAYSPTQNTQAQAYAEGNAYLACYHRKYQFQTASQITYPGLINGQINGRIAQVAWEWAVNAPPSTTVYEGDELDFATLSTRARRRNLQVEATL